jgi:CBS domain containing-hemolysin-like protein
LIGIVGVPLAVGIAILRYHLYDIDLIIRRTLVYGSLTVLLAAVYFGGVALIGAIFQAITLREKEPQFVIVVTTLAIAALFNPLRRRIQWLIDRRFYRRRYDANKVLHTFSVRLRDETDLDRLTRELEGVVGQTMQPAHLSLWLRTRTDPSETGK